MENDIRSSVWPEWQIVKQIGKGSFGVVYEAVRNDDYQVQSRAAIKVISIPQNESEIDSIRSEGLSYEESRTYFRGVVEDFVSEIRLMESFKGVQNIVSVEDYKVVEKTDEIGWDIYIRMELLTPFNSYISDKTLTEREVIKLGEEICTALEYCAKCNVIHRDIKPENIFVNQFGDFKLGDFGIARKLENATGGLSQKGTYNYMAPEVEKGSQYDATVDIYSLGLVLYRLLNKNRLPFLDTDQAISHNERMAAIRRRMDGEELPAPCIASPDMAGIILCACSPDPGRRFASATAMKNALMSIAGSAHGENEDILNETVAVRRPVQTGDTDKAADTDKTVSVRKAPAVQQSEQKSANTFGEKKKSKAPAIIAAVLAVAILGGGVFAIARLFNESGEENGAAPASDQPVDVMNLPASTKTEYEDNGRWKEIEYGGDTAVREQRYTADGDLYYFWQGEFDQDGNRVRDLWYDTDGNVGLYAENAYDAAGNAVKNTFYKADDSLDSWCAREYDDAGNETARTWYYPDGRIYCGYKYDTAGNQIEEIYYDSDGSVSGWYEYDAVGNQIKDIHYNSDGSVAWWYEYEYEYDTAGNQIKWIRYDGDGSVDWWYEYEYDAAGNQVKWIRYDSDGSVDWGCEYEYDAAGNQVKEISYKPDGSVSSWYEHEYDAAGNEIKGISYYGDGSINLWYEYEYDAAGNEIKEISYYGDRNVRWWYEYEYDAVGNLLKWISYDSDGSVDWWYEYEYDAAGNQVKEISYDSDGSIDWRYEYEYDAAGNEIKWIRYNADGSVEGQYEYVERILID